MCPSGRNLGDGRLGDGRLGDGPIVEVETCMLCDMVGDEHVDFLKIDCEMEEYQVLSGAATMGTLARIDEISGEWHGIGRDREIREILNGYVVETEAIPGFNIGYFRARREII